MIPAWSGEVASLIDLARTHNADLLKAQAELRAAMARVPQARALPDPAVQFEGMGKGGVDAEQTVSLAQTFPWPGSLGHRESVASLQARAYWHEAQAMELRVVSRIRAVITEYGFLRKKADLIRQNLMLFRKQEDFLEQTARGGGDVSELVRVEMESAMLTDELHGIEEMQTREMASLTALVGNPLDEKTLAALPFPARLSPLADRTELMAKLETRNPELQSLASRVEAARLGARLARLQTYPEFMLSAGYRRTEEMQMDEAMLMFSVSLPIWKEKNRGAREEAAAMLEAARQEYAAGLRMRRSQLEGLLSRERDASRRAALFQERLLPRARQAHEAVEASYRSGKAALLDVFDSRRRLLEAETGYWRAAADLRIQRAEIDALFGSETQTSNP